ncbi:MAG: peptidoglycan-associated lipoprotein Pal [Pseudomonadota bacterium]
MSFLRAALCAAPVLLAACSSTPTQPAAQPAPAAAAPAAQPATPSAPAPVAAPAPTLAAHLDPNNPVSRNRSVYFDFDESAIRPQDRAVIELQGPYLAKNPALNVRVEGHTDERGSSEYNLALGQRRAEAVKNALKVYGVKESQVEAVSFGKEKPRATGHDETAWAQNRRADIVYR